mmetsp:Transcript_69758/g.204573  ORF Transcript_69758/g.204573 Transcript_69758/m.204573 type:complete len:264 (+) Transcript_69758:1003-1794(+)
MSSWMSLQVSSLAGERPSGSPSAMPPPTVAKTARPARMSSSFIEAPSSCTSAAWPQACASCAGVCPSEALACASAPALSSAWTTALCPPAAASCRAVRPLPSESSARLIQTSEGFVKTSSEVRVASVVTFLLSSTCTHSRWPCLAAICSGVRFVPSGRSILLPKSTAVWRQAARLPAAARWSAESPPLGSSIFAPARSSLLNGSSRPCSAATCSAVRPALLAVLTPVPVVSSSRERHLAWSPGSRRTATCSAVFPSASLAASA